MTNPQISDPSPFRRPTPAGQRFVDVRANLLPPEVLNARRTDVVRRRVLTALVAVAVLIGLGFGAAWYQTHSARSDLAGLNGAIASRETEQNSFAKLAQAQNAVQSTRTQLSQLMVGDLSWKSLIGKLQSAAPSGTTISNVTGSVTATSAGQQSTTTATGANPLNTSGKAIVGTLTLNGTARDSKSVAAYADTVSKIKGLTSVMVTSVNAGTSNVTFAMTVSLTSDALGGRFTPTSTSQGGN